MRRRTWLILACIVLAATAAIGGTLAYLTDNDSAVNTMVMGKVDIEMMEYNADGSKFTDGQTLLPGDTLGKQIEVENVGPTDAFVRTWVAVQQGANGASVVTPNWKDGITATKSSETATIEGKKYDLYYVDYALKSGEKLMTLDSITLDRNAGNADIAAIGSEMKIPVFTQAVQQANMGNMTDALTEAFPKHPWSEGGDIPGDDSADLYITSVTDLFGFAKSVNEGNNWGGKTVELMADIDLAGKTWTPIGNVDSYPTISFQGTFKGNGHTISNMKAVPANPNSGVATAGLFGSASGAIIKDLTLTNVDVQSTHYAGALIGYISDGNSVTVENCKVIGGSVTSTPLQVGKEWDNGDKVGGILGQSNTAGSGVQIKDCSVQNVTVTGYRDVGKIVGYWAGPADSITGCAAQGVTLVCNKEHNYKKYTTDEQYDIGDYVGEGNEPVHGTVETAYANDTESFLEAINMGATTIHLSGSVDGSSAPFAQGKKYTVIGDVDGIVYDLTALTFTPQNTDCELYFENLNIKLDTKDYGGYAHTKLISYKNCSFEGMVYCYGQEVNFDNCTFSLASAEDLSTYNVKTYGVPLVTFKDCTFNSNGRCVYVYNEGAKTATNTFDDCTFNDSQNGNVGKGAVETGVNGSNMPNFTLKINNCTANGFAENSDGYITNSNLWGNKHNIPETNLHVYINGVKVYGN